MLLSMYSEWHRNDFKNRHLHLRKSILSVLKSLINLSLECLHGVDYSCDYGPSSPTTVIGPPPPPPVIDGGGNSTVTTSLLTVVRAASRSPKPRTVNEAPPVVTGVPPPPESGRKALIEADGLRLLYTTCHETPNDCQALEPLVMVTAGILRRFLIIGFDAFINPLFQFFKLPSPSICFILILYIKCHV